MMDEQKYITDKLAELHIHENEMNLKISHIDKAIKHLTKQKRKIAQQISNNMKYRNVLIERNNLFKKGL